eukprot:2149084-Ditylum_brightwellii.AAC.1
MTGAMKRVLSPIPTVMILPLMSIMMKMKEKMWPYMIVKSIWFFVATSGLMLLDNDVAAV